MDHTKFIVSNQKEESIIELKGFNCLEKPALQQCDNWPLVNDQY